MSSLSKLETPVTTEEIIPSSLMVQPVPQAPGGTANDAQSVHLMAFDETPPKKDDQNKLGSCVHTHLLI